MSHILYYIKDKSLKLTPSKDVHNKLYYLEARVPNDDDIKNHIKDKDTDVKIKDILKQYKSTQEAINQIKIDISKVDNYIPLYDEYSRNLYIINRDNVYDRVIHDYYRFPNEHMIDVFKKKRKDLKEQIKTMDLPKDVKKSLGEYKSTSDIHYEVKASQYFIIREYRKLSLLLEFLNNFDLDTLQSTYVNAFYYYSNKIGKDITVCRRPSFLPHLKHITPYYSRSELINLALNMEKISSDQKYYDPKKINELCKIVRHNDIRAETLKSHQQYIINNDKIGIIQYYSLQGSYFINQYLRGLTRYQTRNILLEKSIRSMWELIDGAPKFDREYTLYRFIKNDSHLKFLSEGDNYITPSFVSTTRDPFYRSDIYKFGFILIKIKIPKNVKGIALCIETISHFPAEEEIILPPLSVLRLDKKDKNIKYFHTDKMTEDKVNTRYEFTYLGKEPIKFKSIPEGEPGHIVDFLIKKQSSYSTVGERISDFVNRFTNEMNQFETKIGNKTYTLITEWYNSTSVYKNFYAAHTDNGFIIYTIIKDYVSFTIEIGEDSDGSHMYVNYYFRYSNSTRAKEISDEDFILFLSKVAYYFEIPDLVLYADYSSCDTKIKRIKVDISDRKASDYDTYHGGNYCTDFYNYLKSGNKRYLDKSITAKFSYDQLDRLKKEDPLKILLKDEQDHIYQIYVKTYLTVTKKDKHNIADFYIHLVDNHCVYVPIFTEKMYRLFKDDPFKKDYYVLNAVDYLYDRKLIDYKPDFEPSKVSDDTALDKTKDKHPKNRYRLDMDDKHARVPSREQYSGETTL